MRKAKEHSCESCPVTSALHFGKFEKTDLQYLNEQKTTEHYKKGRFIYKEGFTSLGVYCLREGKIKIFQTGLDGREHIIRIALPGEFFGLKAILSGHDHSASAESMEESTLCFIKKADFLYVMNKYPDFKTYLMLVLSNLLEKAETRLVSIAYKPVRERLAESLLFLYKSFYPDPGKSVTNDLNLTRMEIANIIGTAQETVTRLLSEFKKDKLISVKGRKIYITDPERLKLIANIKESQV
jgi:CRP/FNR family transcriptional regulator